MLAENEEGVGEVVTLVFGIAPDAPAKGRARETVGDRGGTFKSRTGTERGYGGPTTRNQGAPSSASALDRHALNFFDQLLERHGTAPIQKLACELLGAGGRALEGHQQSGLHLR